MTSAKPFGRSGRIVPPRPLPSLQSAFATRRAIFGVLDLREDRIKADSYLAEDLSPAARRALREGEPV